ncbi:ABC transporter substrate-binding protein [Citricoccus nitrophenolicus]|uniref:ABC transporter substrate-binding protein n=1 Tax=Citricoccus nitrophenolicus TaxID=863575 RepID=A0ABV0IG11_9MICC
MKLRRTLRPAAATTTVALMVGLTACGGSAATEPVSGSGSSSAAAEEVLEMTVARGGVNIENAVLADEQGFFEEEGLDIGEMQLTGMGGAAANSSVISGEFDVAATDAVTVIRAVAEGMPVVAVAGTKSADPDYEGEVSDGIVVPPGSDIKEWADLEGKKIGVPELGGLPHMATMTGLLQNGVDPASVEFVPLPTDALVEAAAKGQVDAVFTFSIFLLSAVDSGFTRVGTGVREYLPNAPQVLWVASKEFAEKNPEALERFHNAIEKGTEYGNGNEEAVRQAYHDHTQLPAPFIDERMVLEPLNVEFDEEGWNTLLQVMKDEGDLREDLTYEEIVWEGAR